MKERVGLGYNGTEMASQEPVSLGQEEKKKKVSLTAAATSATRTEWGEGEVRIG